MSKSVFLLTFLLFNFWFFGEKILDGRVRVIGNEPHTLLVITTKNDVNYEVVGKYRDVLWNNYQNYNIKVKIKIVEKSKSKLIPSKIEILEIVNPR